MRRLKRTNVIRLETLRRRRRVRDVALRYKHARRNLMCAGGWSMVQTYLGVDEMRQALEEIP